MLNVQVFFILLDLILDQKLHFFKLARFVHCDINIKPVHFSSLARKAQLFHEVNTPEKRHNKSSVKGMIDQLHPTRNESFIQDLHY